MNAGCNPRYTIGQRLLHKPRGVTGVVTAIYVEPDAGLMVRVTLDTPITVPVGPGYPQHNVLTHMAPAHEFRAADAPAACGIALPDLAALWPDHGGHFAGLLPGLHGEGTDALIVSRRDSAGDYSGQWLPHSKAVPRARSYHDGRANTAAMAEAGSVIAQHALALQIDGHDDWHIPAQAEAHLLAATRKALFKQFPHWTSTQLDARSAWRQNFHSGTQSLCYITHAASVRAVRRFSLQPFGGLVLAGAAT